MYRNKTALIVLVLALMIGFAAPSVFAGPKGPTIVDVAVEVNSSGPYAGSFDTLIIALGLADPAVLETLSGNGQFTVFAPTDTAFDNLKTALGEATFNAILADPAALTDILLYHVARGNRDAADVTSSSRIRMLNGDFAMVNGATIDGANIIIVDVPAANGIIHVVDAVLIP